MKKKIILLLSTLLILFILTELIFTILVDEDLDGNLSYSYIHLRPYKLPVKETKKKIDDLLKHKLPDSLAEKYKDNNFKRKYFDVRLIPDSLLGWVPNPYYKSKNNLYIYNKNGIRSKTILDDYSDKKTLRIAIFGDSYSHGDEVKFKNTIGNYLENLLAKQNIDAEVINFAVSGYGIDQAFLRWETLHNIFKPDIVILGVQLENAKRHINLLRPFYFYVTQIPYSKPRFLLQGNKLQLLTNPILDVTKTANIIEHFDNWKFSHFEGFYSDEKYNPSFWKYSKAISFVSSAIYQIFKEVNFYEPQSESYKITYKIFEQFKDSVELSGEIFIPVHLPVRNDFDFLTKTFIKTMYNQKFIYDELFDVLQRKANFVTTYNALRDGSSNNKNNSLFVKRHYSALANKIIAEQVFEFIQQNNKKLLIQSEEQN